MFGIRVTIAGDSPPVTSILIASSTCYRHLGEFHFGSEDSSVVLHLPPFLGLKRGNYRENYTRVISLLKFLLTSIFLSFFYSRYACVTSDWVIIFIRATQQIGLHTNVYA